MDAKPFNVLFLCTGNSARSIIAEALMNKEGKDRFQAHSAGSMPTGKVNPHVRPIVESCGFQLSDFRSKAWDEFAAPGAPDGVRTWWYEDAREALCDECACDAMHRTAE